MNRGFWLGCACLRSSERVPVDWSSVLLGDKLGEVGRIDHLVPFLNNGQPLEEEL